MALITFAFPHSPLAVIPILIGPLQVLIAILPAILVAIGGALLTMFKPSTIKLTAKVLWRNKLATLLAIAVVAGVCWGVPKAKRALWPDKATTAFSGKAEWPLFRGGLDRRGGGTDGAADPVGGGKVWAFAEEYKTYYSSPALVGNRIVASAAKKEVFADRGAIYCLDAQSGKKVWEFAPSDFRATYSSPSVFGKYVVCGEGLHETHNARIFCLSFDKGEKQWEVRASSHVESSPCFYSNLVFCGAGADGVYAMRLDTPAGQLPVVWHLRNFHDMGLDGSNTFHCDSSLAASAGCVYFTSAELHGCDWSGVACVDAATGKCKWKVDTDMSVWGSPTIVSNRLFVGMGNGNMVESAEQYWTRKQKELRDQGRTQKEIDALAPKYAPGGLLLCLDVATGKKIWSRPLAKSLLGAVAAADGKLYFAAVDGVLTCISVDNELLGQWPSQEAINTCPAVGSNLVYVTTTSGRFFGIDRRTMKPVWQTRLGSGKDFTSSPVVAGGHIYIGTPEEGLLCMGNPANRQVEPIWSNSRGNSANQGSVDGSALPAKGAFAWRWPADLQSSSAVPPVSGSLACLNNTLYVPVRSGSLTGLVALAVGTAAGAKAPETNMWFVATALPISGGVAATTARVYFAEGKIGDAGRKLRCVNSSNGRELWQAPVAAAVSGEFLLTYSNLFAFCRPNELSCLDIAGGNAGRALWTGAVRDPVGAPCLSGDLLLVATRKDGVVALHAGSGKVLWTQPAPEPSVAAPIANDDVAVVATANGLVGLSLVNGGTLWRVACAPSGAPLAANDDRVFCPAADGEILVVDWNGREIVRLKNAVPGLPLLLCGDKLLYATSAGLQRVDFGDKHVETRWLTSAWGTPFAAPILSDGTVYFATAEKGLICARQGKR